MGTPAQATMNGIGTPRGFVGTQYDPDTGNPVPTVWLNGNPYTLPTSDPASDPTPIAMDEHQTANGLQVDVIGYCGCSPGRAVYWQGTAGGGGFTFSEVAGVIPAQLCEVYGMSTNGSMIFGDWNCDPGDGDATYYTDSQALMSNPCGYFNDGLGDSRGDILLVGSGLCLAQPIK